MADNISITQGSGTTIATEDVSGVQHQKVKVEFGTDGVATMVSSSDPLPVTASAGTNLNTSALALESGGNLAAAATSLATLDNIVSGSEAQVDVVGALPAGDNNIGNIDLASSIPAGTNNIGDVDVLSVPRSQSGPGEPGTAIDSYNTIALNLSAGNNQVLVSSAANKQIWVYGIGFTLSAAGTVSFQDEDDTAITGVMNFAQYSGLNTPPRGNFSMPIWKLATDKDLEVDLVTADLDGWLNYAIVSV